MDELEQVAMFDISLGIKNTMLNEYMNAQEQSPKKVDDQIKQTDNSELIKQIKDKNLQKYIQEFAQKNMYWGVLGNQAGGIFSNTEIIKELITFYYLGQANKKNV